MVLEYQIKLFTEIMETASKELGCSLPTFFSKINVRYYKLITEDCDDITDLYKTAFNQEYPQLQKLGLNFLGIGDTRFAISIGNLVFKMEHSKSIQNKGNYREVLNWNLILKYSPDMASLFVNPLLHLFKYNDKSVLVYKKCKMLGQDKLNDVFDRNQFMRDMGVLFGIISGDYQDMNVGYFGNNPLYIDIDSLSTNCSSDLFESFNTQFEEFKKKYPKQLNDYIRAKKAWLRT
jgi:hypothetical protein